MTTPTDLDALATALAERTSGRVERDVPLRRLTTYRLGGPAELLFEPASVDDVAILGELLEERGLRDVPVLALGRGSNVVVSDAGLPGIVLHLGSSFAWIRPGDDDGAVVAGAATPLPQLANWAARRGLAGAEFMIAIPGSVGGAVRMNAGAHGRETADSLTSARVLQLEDLAVRDRIVASLGYGYRRSNLTESDVVLEATFAFSRADPGAVRARMESYRVHRAETQPGAAQNAGSVFKNPPGDHAGRLVDAAGLKGFRVGGASVSMLHANFFMAEEGASAQEVFDLVHEVRSRVRSATGIDLEPEIRFVGRFRAPTGREAAR